MVTLADNGRIPMSHRELGFTELVLEAALSFIGVTVLSVRHGKVYKSLSSNGRTTSELSQIHSADDKER